MLQVIAGYDPSDPASANVPVPDYIQSLNQPLENVRIAVPEGYFASPTNPETLRAVEQAAKVFAGMGAILVEKGMPFAEEMFQMNRTILSAEAATMHEGRMRERRGDFGEDVLARLVRGTTVTTGDYVRARHAQAELIRALDLYFGDVDLVLTPTTRTPAERWGEDAVSMAGSMTGLTAPFNLTGFPAISVPCGFTSDGLPIGMQLIAKRWNEALLLRAAHQYQQVTDWHRRHPNI